MTLQAENHPTPQQFTVQLLAPYKKYLLYGMASLIIVDVADIMPPVILKYAIDSIERGQNFATLAWCGLALLLTAAIQGVFRFFWRQFFLGTSHNSVYDLRKALLKFIGDFADWNFSSEPKYLQAARGLVKAAHPEETPLVVDPFSGGGSIPLEALRLGCEAFASDLNPVAGLILKPRVTVVQTAKSGITYTGVRIGASPDDLSFWGRGVAATWTIAIEPDEMTRREVDLSGLSAIELEIGYEAFL